MAAAIRELVVVCPDCHDHSTLLFRGRKPIGNYKWRVGRGNSVYHCKCPCHTLNFN